MNSEIKFDYETASGQITIPGQILPIVVIPNFAKIPQCEYFGMDHADTSSYNPLKHLKFGVASAIEEKKLMIFDQLGTDERGLTWN